MSAYQDALTLLAQGDAQATQLMQMLREANDPTSSPDDVDAIEVIVSHLAMTQIVLVAQVHAILAVADAIRDTTGGKS